VFSELPTRLGLPSIHTDAWDPFLAACNETGVCLNMHIGSSSTMAAASPDAPVAVSATLTCGNAMASMVDWLFSGKLVQFPNLKLAYAESQIGWIPYILERADDTWTTHRAWGGVADKIPEPPSSYYRKNMYGCFFRDQFGVQSLASVGVDNATFETDYPHVDSTWPDSKKIAEELHAELGDDLTYKVLRGNAIRMLSLDMV
jgi:predicted TIM-barrel fold metal-dependent hydrolase